MFRYALLVKVVAGNAEYALRKQLQSIILVRITNGLYFAASLKSHQISRISCNRLYYYNTRKIRLGESLNRDCFPRWFNKKARSNGKIIISWPKNLILLNTFCFRRLTKSAIANLLPFGSTVSVGKCWKLINTNYFINVCCINFYVNDK